MIVLELVPGDHMVNGDAEAIFITQLPHAEYAGMRLVVWYLLHDTVPVLEPPRFMFDALRPDQELYMSKYHPSMLNAFGSLRTDIWRVRADNLRRVLKP